MVDFRCIELNDASMRNPVDFSGGIDCQTPKSWNPGASIRPSSPVGMATPAPSPAKVCAVATVVFNAAIKAIDRSGRRNMTWGGISHVRHRQKQNGPRLSAGHSLYRELLERDSERDRDEALGRGAATAVVCHDVMQADFSKGAEPG